MPFSENGSAIAVLPQYLRHGGGAVLPQRIVARISSGPVGDNAEAHSMMVPSGQQCCSCRGAHCGRKKAVVTQSLRCELIELGCLSKSTKGTGIAKANIVEQN